MSLDAGKAVLKQGILDLQNEMMQKDSDAFEFFAEKLATLIYDFVKTGDLDVDIGILVSTTGSSTAQTGKTTSKGTGKIK